MTVLVLRAQNLEGEFYTEALKKFSVEVMVEAGIEKLHAEIMFVLVSFAFPSLFSSSGGAAADRPRL
jgi:hypothetical protein